LAKRSTNWNGIYGLNFPERVTVPRSVSTFSVAEWGKERGFIQLVFIISFILTKNRKVDAVTLKDLQACGRLQISSSNWVFNISADTLLNDGENSVVELQNQDLKKQLKLINQLDENEKNALVKIIKSMLTKKRMKDLLDSKVKL